MRANAFAALVLMVSVPSVVHAGPMPVLPDLPPLPTDYAPVSEGGGFYAGVLAGTTFDPQSGHLAALTGYKLRDDALILGVEGLVGAEASGGVTVDVGLRGGFLLDDGVELAVHASAGIHNSRGVFASFGPSIQIDLGASYAARAMLRHHIDLDTGTSRDAVLLGVVFEFQ